MHLAVFHSASAAALAAIDIQQVAQLESWPTEAPPRIGLSCLLVRWLRCRYSPFSRASPRALPSGSHLSPDGKSAATASHHGTARVWDAAAGRMSFS